MSLIKQFELYYQHPSIPNPDLIEAIRDYNFSDYEETVREIALLKRRYLSSQYSFQVKSNGSTGGNPYYQFAPHFGYWCSTIEKILRNYDIQVRIIHQPFNDESSFYINPYVTKNKDDNYNILIDLSNIDNINKLTQIIEPLSYKHKVSICSKPHSWFFLSTHQESLSCFEQLAPYTKNLVNEDWELWVKPNLYKSFFMNDQMIDWKTGLNFFTCPQGNKHFLPIFYSSESQSSNLINLAFDSVIHSDEFIIGDKTLCPCGKFFMPLSFKSHRNNYLDIPRNIINSLSTGYLNFQFVLQDQQLYLMYTKKDKCDDLDKIRNVINRDFIVRENVLYYVGTKRFPFWIANNVFLLKNYYHLGNPSIKLL